MLFRPKCMQKLCSTSSGTMHSPAMHFVMDGKLEEDVRKIRERERVDEIICTYLMLASAAEVKCQHR